MKAESEARLQAQLNAEREARLQAQIA